MLRLASLLCDFWRGHRRRCCQSSADWSDLKRPKHESRRSAVGSSCSSSSSAKLPGGWTGTGTSASASAKNKENSDIFSILCPLNRQSPSMRLTRYYLSLALAQASRGKYTRPCNYLGSSRHHLSVSPAPNGDCGDLFVPPLAFAGGVLQVSDVFRSLVPSLPGSL